MLFAADVYYYFLVLLKYQPLKNDSSASVVSTHFCCLLACVCRRERNSAEMRAADHSFTRGVLLLQLVVVR